MYAEGGILPRTLMNWEIVSSSARQCRNGGCDHLKKLVVKTTFLGREYTFGHITKDTPFMLRVKFCEAFFGQACLGVLVHLPYKVCDLLSGGFVRRGIEIGNRKWEHLQHLDPQARFKNLRITGYLLLELAKDVTKIATLPLALVSKQFIALVGLLDPMDARFAYAAIEDAYATGYEEKGAIGDRVSLWLNFSMPCGQSKEVWDHRNIYKQWFDQSL